MLWLKKKFVVETNYCITLDRVPKKLYPQIIENKAQIEEWVRLFAIDEIEPGQPNLLDAPKAGFSDPLTIEFLEQNPCLVLDTAFFPAEFKEELIDSIDNLDDSLDGLLIHSENSQALNLLQERYKEQVKCVYIDPPYNTDASAIIYKNGYKDSSWLSFMANRLSLANKILSDKGMLCVTIDDFEFHRLKMVLENIYGQDRILGVVCIQNNPSGRSTAKGFSISHEYGIFVSKNENTIIGRFSHSNEQIARYKYVDEIGNFEWVNFRKHGGANANRHARPKLFYPIFISEEYVRIPQIEWNASRNAWSLTEEPRNNEKIIYPMASNGDEKTWKWGHETARENISEFSVRKDQLGEFGVYMKSRLNEDGTLPLTIWNKKEYSSTEYGTNLLKRIFGESDKFSFPKSVYATKDCLKVCNFDKTSTVIDYFAGSGTTGHSVINLNREDDGSRKYILVEMGEYFDTVTKPRVQKVIYSEDWKDGKPVSRRGSSHAFKYLRLESYEDTLNNIEIEEVTLKFLTNPAVKEQYLLQYMLPDETRGSASLLNLDLLEHPFDYAMNITRRQESEVTHIDLVETFNYLIGLNVERSYARQSFDADFTTGEYGAVTASLKNGPAYRFKMVEGTTNSGDRTLVIWRDLTGDKIKDNAVLDAFFERKKTSATDFKYKKIHVNGDNNLYLLAGDESCKVILIEEEMKKHMFSAENI
ncbi:site-specific DNA-methyltransferase [Pelotomaculum propionicicum]|uniref:site-specific DNA-methyltransferase n=1 Tax=Pelotomaculum propionicicum TaxID=258475 RepID=UPI003B7982A0